MGANIELLEEENIKLETVMDDARHDLEVATETVKNLKKSWRLQRPNSTPKEQNTMA